MTGSPSVSEPQRRLLVAVDVERYSRQDNLAQYRTQRVFQWALNEACERLGLDRLAWRTQQSGDGELAILPAGTSEPALVAHFGAMLDGLLREHNRDLVAEARVRIRVALHVGLVHLDGANGYPGTAAVTVCRLVDAKPLKRALAAFPAAGAVQIVSEQLYDDVVAQRYQGLRPERYTRVRIALPDKGFDAAGWITVPDESAADVERASANTGDPADPGDAAGSGPVPAGPTVPAQRPGGGFHFGNLTTNGPAAFGENSRAVSNWPEVPR
jgi:hypothetical protein